MTDNSLMGRLLVTAFRHLFFVAIVAVTYDFSYASYIKLSTGYRSPQKKLKTLKPMKYKIREYRVAAKKPVQRNIKQRPIDKDRRKLLVTVALPPEKPFKRNYYNHYQSYRKPKKYVYNMTDHSLKPHRYNKPLSTQATLGRPLQAKKSTDSSVVLKRAPASVFSQSSDIKAVNFKKSSAQSRPRSAQ